MDRYGGGRSILLGGPECGMALLHNHLVQQRIDQRGLLFWLHGIDQIVWKSFIRLLPLAITDGEGAGGVRRYRRPPAVSGWMTGILETFQRSLIEATSYLTIAMASVGQRTMHSPQRMHFSSSMIISAPASHRPAA